MLGSVLGPLALVLGAIAATLEGVWPPHGVDVVGELVDGPKDVAAPPGSGKVVSAGECHGARRRAGFADTELSRSAGCHHGGKSYEFLVEREQQPW